jgi:uncharacterized protein (TIGR03435 family)
MAQLADVLLPSVNRVVVDRTGLTGAFDLELAWTSEPPALFRDGAIATDRAGDSSVSMVTALREQLGLKLESTSAAVDVLVIDRAERTTPD